MPRKTFTAGEVLAAADVNTFLMDQSVMSFAGTAARGSAIGTATEGMLTYLNDSDSYESWNGSAWVGLGGAGGAATNAIINGGFDIWQRGTSVVGPGYLADRFAFNAAGAGTVTQSRQTFTPGAAPVAGYESSFFYRAAITTAFTDSNLTHKVEDARTFAGQTATLSFFAKADAAKTLALSVRQLFGTGGSTQVAVDLSAASLTTSWQRFSYTISVPSVSGKTIGAGSSLDIVLGTTAQTGTFDIWGVQLEAGSTATPFRRNANSLQGELAACQRYFYRLGSEHNSFGSGNFADSLNSYHQVRMLVPMRTSPTISFSAVGTFKHSVPGVADVTLTNIIAANPKAYDFQVVASSGSNAAFQTGRGATFFSGGSATIDVSAEL
jgi:hypothetical protein